MSKAKRRKTGIHNAVKPSTDQAMAPESRPDDRSSRIGSVAVALFMTLVLAAVLCRAAFMSMTWDEAYTVCVYVADGKNIFSPDRFLANNHVFHTLLVWLAFQAAPWEEWCLRLPAVLGAVGIVLTLRQLGRLFFGDAGTPGTAWRNTFFLLAVVLLHPLVFQFLSFARGYGLSVFFSLLGFYCLLRILDQKPPVEPDRGLLLVGGLAFGLSVTSNLTAALMNASLICVAGIAGFFFGRLTFRSIPSLLFCFCAPGASIVLGLYLPFFLHVSFDRFDYANASLLQAVIDMTAWSLGNTNVVPEPLIQRLVLGVPVPAETFWLTVASIPFLIGVPLLLTASVVAVKVIRRRRFGHGEPGTVPHPVEWGILIVFGGILLYAATTLVVGSFGKPIFPKDRTGLLPTVYGLMLPVLLLGATERLKSSRFAKPLRVALTALIVGVTVQFASLFAFPYYHNIWYGDADIRSMMSKVRRIDAASTEPKTLVFAAVNEPAVEFYAKKYKLDRMELRRVLRPEAVEVQARRARHTIYILPDETEELLRRLEPNFRRLQKNPYTGLFLADAPGDTNYGPGTVSPDAGD